MSWGTDFTANVFIKNKLIKTKADAESELDYAQSEKQKIREINCYVSYNSFG